MDKKKGVSKRNKSAAKMSEMIFWLDDYTDFFSDFDPRPYSQRSLSFDFVAELKRASRDKFDKIKLSLLLPKAKRDSSSELAVRKRLYEHFGRYYERAKKKSRGILKQGIMFCIFGVITMFIATLVYFYFGERSLLTSFLVILLEPAGWFLFWEGLGLAIFERKKERPTLEFYEKMSKCRIYFSSY